MQIPEIPEANFEELKKDLQEKVSKYENIIYNDNEIAQAKKDRADLNKLKKAINDKRIAMEKEYMQPFNEFKAKVNEILALLDKPILAIDTQVKNYEAQLVEAKKQWIEATFKQKSPFNWIKLEQIYNSKWLNSSFSKNAIEEEMDLSFSMIETELKSIDTLDYKEQALEVYKETLSLSMALDKVKQIKDLDKILEEQKAKAEVKEEIKEEPKPEVKEEVKVETAAEDPKEWMDMSICLSALDFEKFDAWTKENGIEWRIK
jgi:hypothetical protein